MKARSKNFNEMQKTISDVSITSSAKKDYKLGEFLFSQYLSFFVNFGRFFDRLRRLITPVKTSKITHKTILLIIFITPPFYSEEKLRC